MELDLSPLDKAERVAVIGIGSELRGDDSAGIKTVGLLKKKLDSLKVLLIDTGTVPENFGSKIEEFNPSHIVIVDAVDMKEEPGVVKIIDPGKIVGEAMSTHKLPLSIFIEYLQERVRVEILIIGIQALRVGMGEEMTEEVRLSVESVAKTLSEKLGSL